jgi:beta-1,4-mannosyltransferase
MISKYSICRRQLSVSTTTLQLSLLSLTDRGRSVVLHDRPPANFRRTDPIRQHELFNRLMPDFLPELPDSLIPDEPHSTIFTSLRKPNNLPTLIPERPALLVSSTSWTADEDFSLLLTALDEYQAALTAGLRLPRLLVVITGKGALRKPFEKAVAEREKAKWKDVTVRFTDESSGYVWLWRTCFGERFRLRRGARQRRKEWEIVRFG